MEPIYSTGVIHGRFQVLHNDHVEYLLHGKSLCRHLVVGITNPEPAEWRPDQADTHRDTPMANPLTYYERYVLVRTALAGEGIDPRDFSVVPLPIHDPDRYGHYVPLDAVFFLTIYDDWGRKKRDRFASLRLKTHVLREVEPEEKGISASEVRRRMVDGAPWAHLVPDGVARRLEQWKVPERLRRMSEGGAPGPD